MAARAHATSHWRVLASPRGSMLRDRYFDLSEPESAAAQRSARLSVLFTGLLYPSWSYLIGALGPPLSPPIHDPVAPRVAVGLVCVLATTLGWRFAWSRNVQLAVRPTAYLLIGHQIWLMNENHMAPIYFAVTSMMVPIMTINTPSRPALLRLLAFNLAGMAWVCANHGEVAARARAGFMIATLLSCGLTYMIISKHRRATAALRESEARVREQSRAVALARD